MLLSVTVAHDVSIAAGYFTVTLVVHECCSLVELYIGIRDGSIEVASTNSRPFEFPETYKEQPFSVVVASKQSGPFQPCNLAAKLLPLAFTCRLWSSGLGIVIQWRKGRL